MRISILTPLVVGLVLAGCGGSTIDVAADGSDTCEGRADFWVAIQQEYLDLLGDTSIADLDPPSETVAAAGKWAGSALLEHAREADAVGCAVELRAGMPLICERLSRLDSRGETGDQVVDRLLAACEPSGS